MKQGNKDDWRELLLAAIAGMCAVGVVGMYATFVGTHFSDDAAKWGQFGDYVGGLINPTVALVTAFLVVRTLRSARDQLGHAEQSADLQEIKFRIDSVVDELRHAMRFDYRGAIGFSESRMVDADPRTSLVRILEHNAERPFIERALHREQRDVEVEQAWYENFLPVCDLLMELRQYLADYENRGGARSAADYYRRRVSSSVTLLGRLGQLPADAVKDFEVHGIGVPRR